MRPHDIIRWCDKIMFVSFCILIYFLPISIALTEVFTNIALFFYLLKRTVGLVADTQQGKIRWRGQSLWGMIKTFFKGYKPLANPLNRPIAVLLIVSVISVAINSYYAVGIRGFMGKALQNAFLYFTFIECMNASGRIKKFITTFMVSMTLISINGLYQHFFGRDFIFSQVSFDHRIASSFRDPNDFGAYLLFVIPVLLSLTILRWWKAKEAGQADNTFARWDKPAMKIWLSLLLLLTLYDFGLTFSRGAWIGLVVSLIWMGINNRQAWKIMLLFLFCAVVFAVSTKATRFDFATAHNFLEDNGRLMFWEEACNIIKHYPVFGAGLNAYSLVAQQYKINWGGYPHNCYLQMAAETGLVGLGVFIWMMVVLFRYAFKQAAAIKAPYVEALLTGFAFGLIGYLVHGFFDTVLYSVQLSDLMWIYMGVMAALPRIKESS